MQDKEKDIYTDISDDEKNEKDTEIKNPYYTPSFNHPFSLDIVSVSVITGIVIGIARRNTLIGILGYALGFGILGTGIKLVLKNNNKKNGINITE